MKIEIVINGDLTQEEVELFKRLFNNPDYRLIIQKLDIQVTTEEEL